MNCSVVGCERKAIARGLCSAHWQRQHKVGNLDPSRPIGIRLTKERHHKWKGGEVIFTDGRIAIHSPNHPFPNYANVYVFRYRLVMEEKLGRFLRPDEIVHHIDGDVTNDDPNNLLVTNRSEHARIHNRMRHANSNGRFSD